MTSSRSTDRLTLLACLLLALAVRLPSLTTFLTADEARSWYGRSIIFLDSLSRANWANTAPGGSVPYIENLSLSPAPGVTTMWAGASGIMLDYLWQGMPMPLTDFLKTLPFDPLTPEQLFPLRLPGVLLATLTVGLTFWWSRPLLGRGGAFLAAGLLALDPFHVGLSRVLGHDAFVANFMGLSILALIRSQGLGGRKENVVKLAESRPPKKGGEASSPAHREGGRRRAGCRDLTTLDRKRRGLFRFYVPLSSNSQTTFLIRSGCFAGLACVSKYPALFLVAFTVLTLFSLHCLTFNPQSRPLDLYGLIRHITLWTIACLMTIVLLWPAMWLDPLGLPTTIISDALRASGNAHQKGSFFMGQPVPDPGPLYYPLVGLLRLSPVVLLGLLGLPLLIRSARHHDLTDEQRISGLILLAYVLFYTLMVTYGGKKQDRYLLPIFPALNILATIGYFQALCWFQAKSAQLAINRRITLYVTSLMPLALQALLIFSSYPYYLSFYNPLMGGAPTAARLIQVGWGEGLNEAAAYLNHLPDAQTQRVTSWYSTTFEPYFNGQAIYKIHEAKISRNPKPGLAADYVVFYINQTQRRLPSEGALTYFQQDLRHVVTLNGLDYAWVYAAPAAAHIIPNQARLIGQAELLAYDWRDDHGQRLITPASGSVPTLRLYWEWQGKQPQDTIGLSLVDTAGQTHGWANRITSTETALWATQPTDALPDGTIITTDYAMPIFPGSMPGSYQLTAWLDQAETGQRIGQFSLTETVTIGRPLAPAKLDDFDIGRRLDQPLGGLTLLGYTLPHETWSPDESHTFDLFWAKTDDTILSVDSIISLTLLSQTDDHSIRTEWVKPFSYPLNQWQLDDHFRQPMRFMLPRYQPAGDYILQLTLDHETIDLTDLTVSGRDRMFRAPIISNLIQARLGNRIELLGFIPSPSHQPDQGLIDLTLFWQATDISSVDYTVFLQLLDEANVVVAQQDHSPQNGAAPTGTWATGEVVSDNYRLQFTPTAGQRYRLIVGLYRPDSGERLPVEQDGSRSDSVVLLMID